eukprot:15473429-Alexandrium_andersonii.AAC.1
MPPRRPPPGAPPSLRRSARAESGQNLVAPKKHLARASPTECRQASLGIDPGLRALRALGG